uniref:Non-specific protein-tyrosine kinase n=1 Tax=Panagrolaimus sp. ES5 TaxID=591445 RepID=A0AC34FJF6_9BILA
MTLKKKKAQSCSKSKSNSQMELVPKKFRSATDLVQHYQKEPIYKKVVLKNPIPRPKWIIPTSVIRFTSDEPLGKGNFANVVKARMRIPDAKDKKSSYIFVAVKMLLEKSDSEGTTEQEREEGRDSMMREAKVMQRYSHKNVIKFFGVACEKPPISLVLEFCPGGSLESHLKKFNDTILASERVQYMLESGRGLRYLHHHHCIHRDLAARNVLVSAEGVIKIADFGLSKVLDKNDIGDVDNINKNVPLRWMAPETISKEPRFSNKSDVWSYGVMCYEIFNNGIKPWADVEQFKVISRAIRTGNMPPLPSKTPLSIANLIKECWSLALNERPEFYEIVRKICSIQETEAELKPLTSSQFTVNSIHGVHRLDKTESAEEMLALKSVEHLNSMRDSSGKQSQDSKETKSKESAEDSFLKRKKGKVGSLNKPVPTTS